MSKDHSGGKDFFGHNFDHYDEQNNYLKKIPMTTLTMVGFIMRNPHLLVNFVVFDVTE